MTVPSSGTTTEVTMSLLHYFGIARLPVPNPDLYPDSSGASARRRRRRRR